MVASAPTLAVEPGQTAAPSSGPQTSLIAQRPIRGASLHTLWSTSNQFGTGQAWVENTASGSVVSHVSFTNLNGETLQETVSSRGINVVSGAGSMRIKRLANGHLIETVYVRPGACASEAGTMTAGTKTAASASVELDAQGKPFHSLQTAKFSSAQKAFACGTAAVRSDMRSSMVQAGLVNASGAAVPPAAGGRAGIVMPGQAHTDSALGCAAAVGELALAAAGLEIALDAAVASIGVLTPAVIAALGAYAVATAHYEAECGY